MGYKRLSDCVADLERTGQLVRIKEEVDPYLEMAAIHRRVFDRGGPAVFFENIKGSVFPAVSNLFGTLDRSRFLFRDTLDKMQTLVALKNDPLTVFRYPGKALAASAAAYSSLPLRVGKSALSAFQRIAVSQLPQIVNWPLDGGPFVTMPQVYTEDAGQPGILHANLGMYRIQLAGNDYVQDREIGLHYQLHRGIGVHQTKANALGRPLKVSIFIGGPPSHALAAVMPLPEGLSEAVFAGALGNRRFRYCYDDEGFCISADADFVITGTVYPGQNKPEGPFGDHLGYYSLTHPFPLMRVNRVYHRQNPVWSFTVVGRPPQEDTSFGAIIHEIAGTALPREIPGLHEVNAVDAAGVHPLLFAIGSERYTPYLENTTGPQELLTIANHLLGKNQLSLAKYLFIAAREDDPSVHTHDIAGFLRHVLERIDLTRDLHFHTRTTIDTLDYSGSGLNSGSKVVFAARGPKRRTLSTAFPGGFAVPEGFGGAAFAAPGIVVLTAPQYRGDLQTDDEIRTLQTRFQGMDLEGIPVLVLCDDAAFTAASLNNLIWVAFTRSNPSHDIHGIGSFIEHKHWGCRGPLVIDARKKPHHAPELVAEPAVEKRVDKLGAPGGSLYGII